MDIERNERLLAISVQEFDFEKMSSTTLPMTSTMFKRALLILIVFYQVDVVAFVKVKDESSSLNVTELDCHMRVLASQYARYIQPFRPNDDIVFRQVDDALQMHDLCPNYFNSTKKAPLTKIKSKLLQSNIPVEPLKQVCSI